MSIGPVQLLVLGFDHPNFRDELGAELERLRENDAVRLIDSLAVYKDADGELEVAHLTNVSGGPPPELGRVVGALIGLDVEGEQEHGSGSPGGVAPGAEDVDELGEPEAWDVLDDIPRDSAAALLLLEHQWAVPLRETIGRAGGFRIADGFISPLDLVVTGLVSAQEAEEMLAIEGGTAATP